MGCTALMGTSILEIGPTTAITMQEMVHTIVHTVAIVQ